MSEYHKINSLYKRDRITNKLIYGDWSIPEFGYLAENKWDFTEKIDGTNVRIIFENGSVSFGGRTDNAQMPVPLTKRLYEIFASDANLTYMREKFPKEGKVVMYGEGFGAKIQKVGHLYSKEQDFILFDIRVGNWWLERHNVESIAEDMGLDVVPFLGEGTLFDAENMVEAGLISHWGHFEAEGIVARPKIELFTRSGQRIIAKIRGEDYKKLKPIKLNVTTP